ncbi:MAG: sulfotransferase [Sulfitobacter sp.]
MQSAQDPTPFVAVGGLGGSGTRLVAQILQKMGFYLGPVLNPPLDNLLFTLLFKRREWFAAFPADVEIDRTIRIFAAGMRDGVEQAVNLLAREEVERLLENARGFGADHGRFEAVLASGPPDLDLYSGLAWKEPNTHVFLPQLTQRFPNMKYIHVIRNGLDMALSRNRQQLLNWGRHYDIQPETEENLPQAQLRYWLAANHRVIETGDRMGSKQFHLLNYDNLCLGFENEAGRLQKFLDRHLSDFDLAGFSGGIGTGSIGRFREVPARTFTLADREAVKQLGFCVD